jgi:hypothetical protein
LVADYVGRVYRVHSGGRVDAAKMQPDCLLGSSVSNSVIHRSGEVSDGSEGVVNTEET